MDGTHAHIYLGLMTRKLLKHTAKDNTCRWRHGTKLTGPVLWATSIGDAPALALDHILLVSGSTATLPANNNKIRAENVTLRVKSPNAVAVGKRT
jgi:hypothetical protein